MKGLRNSVEEIEAAVTMELNRVGVKVFMDNYILSKGYSELEKNVLKSNIKHTYIPFVICVRLVLEFLSTL